MPGSLRESFAHSRYIWFKKTLIPQIGKTRVADDAAQTGPRRSPVITADHSEGTGHRVGTMRDGFEHRLDVRRDEHLPTNLSSTTTTPSSLDGASMPCVPP